jgi:hypothetical protein
MQKDSRYACMTQPAMIYHYTKRRETLYVEVIFKTIAILKEEKTYILKKMKSIAKVISEIW